MSKNTVRVGNKVGEFVSVDPRQMTLVAVKFNDFPDFVFINRKHVTTLPPPKIGDFVKMAPLSKLNPGTVGFFQKLEGAPAVVVGRDENEENELFAVASVFGPTGRFDHIWLYRHEFDIVPTDAKE